jgi:hypothetical protein
MCAAQDSIVFPLNRCLIPMSLHDDDDGACHNPYLRTINHISQCALQSKQITTRHQKY